MGELKIYSTYYTNQTKNKSTSKKSVQNSKSKLSST